MTRLSEKKARAILRQPKKLNYNQIAKITKTSWDTVRTVREGTHPLAIKLAATEVKTTRPVDVTQPKVFKITVSEAMMNTMLLKLPAEKKVILLSGFLAE